MLTFENLVDLGGALRRERFDVSAHQLLAAQDLLLHLAVNGRMPASKAELERWLAPVFCSNPDEQERFPRLYREWLAPLDGPAPGSGGTPGGAGGSGGEPSPPLDWRRIGRRLAYLAAALLLAGGPVAGWFGWDHYLKERTLQGSVAGDHGAIAGATIGFVNRDGEKTKNCGPTGGNGIFSCAYHRSDLPATLDVAAKDYLSQSHPIESPPETRIDFKLQPDTPPPPPPPDGAAATPVATLVPPPAIQTPVPPPQPRAEPLLPAAARVALALLAIGALWWWLWSVYRRGNTRRAVLDRFPAGTAAERYRLHRRWAGGLPRLFAGREMRDALRELRRHRSVVSRQLDAAATVKATVSQRGRFTPVYGRRRAAPEYLVLVDRRSGRDQQARLLDELLARLRRDGVYLDCWDFNGDPRLCWKSTGEARFVAPADLAGLYPEHALLVFSDADGLFEPLSGKVVDWLDAFAHWSQRAIFVPESPQPFAYREHALEQAGFAVLPATPAGLLAFALVDESPPADNGAWPWPYPERLARNPARWLDETPPLAEDEQALCTELRRYLGPMGYFWLAACAIYPAMRWEATVAVGTRLLDSESLARILPALVRLPWFRLGAMPDWLRRRLIGELPPYWKRQARNALWHLLDAAGQGGRVKLPLEFAEEDPPRSEQRRRRQEAAALASLDRGHPLNDRVLLATLTGDTIDPLTLAAPPLLQRLLYLNGQSRYGVRPIIPALATLLVALGLWWLTVPGEGPPIAQVDEVAVKPPPARQTALRPLAYSPDGARLASTSDEAATVLWDVAGRKESLPPLTGHDAQVSALAIGKDVLAEGSEQGTIYRLDPLTGRTLGDPIAAHTGPVQALTVSPDGRTLASGGADGQVKFHDVAPAAPTGAAGAREPKAALPSPFVKVALDPRSTLLAGVPGSVTPAFELPPGVHKIQVVPAAKIERDSVLAQPAAADPAKVAATKRVEPHQGAVSAIVFSSDGKTLASAGADGRVLLWEVASRQPVAELASVAAAGSGRRPALSALAWRADGVLATGDEQGAIVLWNAAARAPLPGSLAKHARRVAALAFSPGGATLASASDDGSLRLWDVAGRTLRGVPLAVHGEAVAAVAWNPDGKGLASVGRSGTVVLWSFADTGPPRDERAFRDCADCPEMVIVPAGRFTMGAPASEEGSEQGERPQHLVNVKSFALGRNEVTVADFERFVKASGYRTDAQKNTSRAGMNEPGCHTFSETGLGFGWVGGRSWRNPEFKQGAAHPAVCLSWNDAQAYAAWQSKRTGKTYRLPSEAEWEYAARAGTPTSRYWGEDPKQACKFANVADRSGGYRNPNFVSIPLHDCYDRHSETAPVGSFLPNAFGLYDMLGNVLEWTQDCWNEGYAGAPREGSAWLEGDCGQRVVRGGSWDRLPNRARAAHRDRIVPGQGVIDLGFRLARTID